MLVGIARGSTALRLAIAGGCALLSIIALEGRLWRPQLFRLGLVSALVFVFTALLAGKLPCPNWAVLCSGSQVSGAARGSLQPAVKQTWTAIFTTRDRQT